MSVEEMIARLEAQKLECVHSFDTAIQGLRELQEPPTVENADVLRPFSFEPIEIKGEPLSQTVIEGRGPY